MALTQVRVQVDGQWYELTHNAATGRWEAYITPTRTSFHEPGGQFNVTAEATNATGTTLTTDGTNIPGLLLTAVETVAPVLTLVSPAQGYVTTGTPDVVFTVTDESGGSGVDISTLSVLLDGVAGDQVTYTAITDGYQVTYTPTVSDGAHTIFITVQDNDGNTGSLKLDYIIDTVPPSLNVLWPDTHVVVDVYSIDLRGHVQDAISPTLKVEATNNGVNVGDIAIAPDGIFEHNIPLEVGENNIRVTVTDEAGLKTVRDIYMIRLVTDRTEEDVAALEALYERDFEEWTAEEKAWFVQAIGRGAYNYTDLNRVVIAMEYLQGAFSKRGTTVDYVPVRTDIGVRWAMPHIPLPSQTQGYLANVETFRQTIPDKTDVPETPPDLEQFQYGEANDIETILVMADRIFPGMDSSYWYCGEISCGEY